MGTNYYWKEAPMHAVKQGWDVLHVCKVSAAGLYCWDCNVPLIIGDVQWLHYTNRVTRVDACPECGGKRRNDEDIRQSAAGVQLGFAPIFPSRPHGVHSCCSISFAQDPDWVRKYCNEHLYEELIEDEYGRPMLCTDFLRMWDAMCPITYRHSVGDHNWS